MVEYIHSRGGCSSALLLVAVPARWSVRTAPELRVGVIGMLATSVRARGTGRGGLSGRRKVEKFARWRQRRRPAHVQQRVAHIRIALGPIGQDLRSGAMLLFSNHRRVLGKIIHIIVVPS